MARTDITAARRRIYRRRRFLIFGGASLVILLGLYLPFALLAPVAAADGQTTAHAPTGTTAAALTWPAFGASAIGAVGYPESFATGGSTDPLAMASISKIITTLVVLQAKPLAVGEPGPTVTFTAANAALVAKYTALDGETKPMKAGTSMSELDLIHVALIASANNYAETLADWAYGSEDAFLTAAHGWLAANHLDHTTFVEPTGIDPANTSTATDLVALGQLALANPVIAQTVDTPTLDVPIIGTINNTNSMLGIDGVRGIKTGTLYTSNLLFAADYRVGSHTVTIVGVILGAADHESLYPAVKSLLTGVEKGFHEVVLATKGQAFAEYPTPWQDPAKAVTTKTTTAAVWSDTPVAVAVAAREVRFADKGADAGEVTFTMRDTVVRVPLALDRTIADPGPWWRLAHPFELSRLAG